MRWVARGGLGSLVIAPLLLERKVFGILVAARRETHGSSSGDCEFLRQLSEHVALAAHQAQPYGALQQAYDDLRQSQQAILQQERLRALGQVASGIAHDINNAISPAALYTESLLERDATLSARARDYLTTIQRAMITPMSEVESPPSGDPFHAPGHAAGLALVARQSLYDRSQSVIAYELLYRRCATAPTADVVDGRQATLQVIMNAVLEIGLDRLAGDLPVHINYPQELLVSSPPLPVPAQRVVIEVLENVRSDASVLQGISRMRARGHPIALDDYSPRVSDPALLDLADIAKLDVSQHTPQELADLVVELKRRPLTLIAEHVETAEEFERCRALGFDAFQGYFLQHPRMFSTRMWRGTVFLPERARV